ncbi:hypothetical protein G7075_09845 [Phycicoccus sp. HDW14]|uniref:hypothetical protein n=1 Tax=Phycicoccus sp. HDW14 TaxID=2714941 RepID=UPI00140BAB09|nr:hypothetical protein [Phycicoccus sp. HDW14]QIM21358.1 hypothetical protein G7075_09845 [Phycicoccus sp. HDW14]
MKVPPLPEGLATAATTVEADATVRALPETGRAGTVATRVRVVGSFVEVRGVAVRHSLRVGVLSAHAGSSTSRNREAQSPP